MRRTKKIRRNERKQPEAAQVPDARGSSLTRGILHMPKDAPRDHARHPSQPLRSLAMSAAPTSECPGGCACEACSCWLPACGSRHRRPRPRSCLQSRRRKFSKGMMNPLASSWRGGERAGRGRGGKRERRQKERRQKGSSGKGPPPSTDVPPNTSLSKSSRSLSARRMTTSNW